MEQPGRLLSRVTRRSTARTEAFEFLAPERHVELARRLRGAGADDHLGEGIRDVAVTLLDAEGGHVHHALVVQLVLVLGLDGVPESVGELGEGVSG